MRFIGSGVKVDRSVKNRHRKQHETIAYNVPFLSNGAIDYIVSYPDKTVCTTDTDNPAEELMMRL